MQDPQLDPRKTPRQARSRKTCDAILRAAAEILAKSGQRGLNTNHVAQKAGVSIGSLYQYFPNKQSIVVALIGDRRQAVFDDMDRVAQAQEGAGLAEIIRAMTAVRLRHGFDRPALAAALERAEAELPPDPALRQQKTREQALIVAVLAEHYVDDPETVARDVLAIGDGMSSAAIAAGEADADALMARVDRSVTGYLSGVPVGT
ncbi:TetR/AcrR family transcriptional regulator [Marinovum sp. 2_MG-2023]|uniref:TetR/AcrR family transcriptional regulator n=1 Tax=Roseobacteraceae TaxID=2854170 RepID=UPI001FCFFF39|nr:MULTISPECIES: TetR/AcrR family transcriptional regulator [Roseobacteraceae]MCJ7872599.1 TetR/AcrR family transcriptional regulator [Phaeobacter sp. J2-8]MDO6730285.1 TetR/AcrR family transcriptional regulator [Marinovum sp. 2_MG-2023]MDO6779023.1 TetR/AcrR family transcriptional regulator [Marinovum sp. 1_MG-2023]